MHPKRLNRSLAAAIATTTVVAASAALLAPSAVSARTAAPKVFFGGQSYGSTAAIGTLVQSGKTAEVPFCTSEVGAIRDDKTGATHLSGLGTIGAVTSRVSSTHHMATVSAISTSSTAKTSLLAGLIRVHAISTRARQSKTGKSNYHSTGTTSLVGLTIAGRRMPVHPSVDRTVDIAGIGTIVLNGQNHSKRDGIHSIKVTALRLTLDPKNMAGLPAGLVTIGHATASLHGPVHHRAYGSAYGTTVQAGATVKSGRTAPVTLACGGSSGHTVINTTARAHLSGAVTSGAVVSYARSTDSAATTTATTRSRVAGVNLFSGKIRIHAITTRAHVARHGTHLSRSAAGTSVLGLTINGMKVPAPRSGTRRTVSGLGTLYFDDAIRTSTGMQVYGVRLVLSAAKGNLKKGTAIIIGSARAGVDA